ncbi:MAG: phosphotyrosine protein phosphatase [Bacteroidetes bacterium]|nr:MAG: phosphotyrosine protein phosphatase [Bacteroidota bacterium]
MNLILFVCSANIERSKTAEDYFSQKYPDIEFRSVGTNKAICQKEGTNYLNEEDLNWAEVIYVMEPKHKKAIKTFSRLKLGKKIKVLNILDHFGYYNPELLELLEAKISI